MRPILLLVALIAFASAAVVPRSRRNHAASEAIIQHMLTIGLHSEETASSGQDTRVVVENYFTTRLNHFNPQQKEDWTLRYLSVTDHYKPGGPILIRLSGNEPVRRDMINKSSLIAELARQMNGAVYAFESRFYGMSKPTLDVNTEIMRFLKSDQIMADLVEFIIYLKRDVFRNEDIPLLVSGVGYGGALATWFRVRYPHMADAAWSSGGYHKAVLDFSDFAETWSETLVEHGSQQCYNELFVAFNVMQNLIDLGMGDMLYEKLNICTEIDPEDSLQVQYFFSTLMTAVEIYTLRNRNLSDFSTFCNELLSTDAPTAVEAFATWFNSRFTEDEGCIVTDLQTVVDSFRQTDWESPFVQNGARQWMYQQCAEFGWFQTTNSAYQPFGDRVTVELYAELCRMVFGEWATEETIQQAAERTNNRFAALAPNTRRIHFTSGSEDPWRAVTIRKSLGGRATADVIAGELSGSEMKAISENDSEELRDAKQRIKVVLEDYILKPSGGGNPGGPRVSEGPGGPAGRSNS